MSTLFPPFSVCCDHTHHQCHRNRYQLPLILLTSKTWKVVMPLFEPLRRFKRLRLFFEPSAAVAGFFLVTAFVIICCFFYLDYREFAALFSLSGQSRRDSTTTEEHRVDFLGEIKGGGVCDLFEGKWVWDENYPLYQPKDCSFIDEGFRCSENGRPDFFYTKWRWQPKHCNLPRFNATMMLEKLRNKRLVFAGDSIGRNQWESLLCMLSSVVPNKESIYEVNGNPITKHKGFLVFRFREFNSTVEYYRAPFLVLQNRPPSGLNPEIVKTTLKVDQMDWSSLKWRDADVLVLNTGHWWNYEKTIRGGCYFQEGMEVKMEMKVEDAYKRSVETVLKWIQDTVNPRKTQVFFRTYAPVHFRGGDWRTGSCHLETLPELGSSFVPEDNWSQFKIANLVLSAHTNTSKIMKVLNITQMTAWRKDGHSSIYYLGPKAPAPLHRQDCSHWCLPGVPDTWNELLYALFLKHENSQTRNL